MSEILEMISRWPDYGQGVFFLIVIGSLIGMVGTIFRYIAICVRGWPAKSDSEDD